MARVPEPRLMSLSGYDLGMAVSIMDRAADAARPPYGREIRESATELRQAFIALKAAASDHIELRIVGATASNAPAVGRGVSAEAAAGRVGLSNPQQPTRKDAKA